MIDGDGWVSKGGYTMNVTSGSLNFAEGLFSVFQSWGLIGEITLQKGKIGTYIHRVWIKGKTELLKLSSIIYINTNYNDFHICKRVFMTQHSNRPYLSEDKRATPRWIIQDGKIVQQSTSSRISLRTNLSEAILHLLKIKAKENNTYINYLIENGLKNVIEQNFICITKTEKPADRIQLIKNYWQM